MTTGRLQQPDAIEFFVEQADEGVRRSEDRTLTLNERIGLYEGGALKIDRTVQRDGALHFKQSKTGAKN